MKKDKRVQAVIDAARRATKSKRDCSKCYGLPCKKCSSYNECIFVELEKSVRKYDKHAKKEAKSDG
jgi:hypothetical protein